MIRSHNTSGSQPPTNLRSSIDVIRLFLGISLAINLFVILMGLRAAHGIGTILGFSGRMLIQLWPYYLMSMGLVVLLGFSRKPKAYGIVCFLRRISNALWRLGNINIVIFAIPILLYGSYRLLGWEMPFLERINPIWTFGHLGLIASIFLLASRKVKSPQALLVTFSIYGLVLWIVYFMPDVSNYPLSLGWSETSRYYYASLFFSNNIYGQSVPLSSLHPTRYLLQGVPFLLRDLPLWVHRFWQVVLWLGITLAGSFALLKHLNLKKWWAKLGIIAWFFMFCFQGPVYYHLMVVIILVLLGFDHHGLRRSLIFVGLASVWAGISRVNWFPVAGMLAATLYILKIPKADKRFWEYWRWPIITVVVSLILAFLSQSLYASISGNPVEVFGSSFNSPLYPYRLFPNEAYGSGILNMTITAIFPLMVILIWYLFKRWRAWAGLRLLALIVILVALLVVGLIVSMKIGGGDNLHNMDAFLVFFAVVTVLMAFEQFKPDFPQYMKPWTIPQPLIVFALLIPLIFVLDALRPYPQLDHRRAWEDIDAVQRLIDEATAEGGEVLFIQHRHLLTFDSITRVALVPEYEKVFLMEMAMSANQPYLEIFWRDLESHRFDLIISEPLSIYMQTSDQVFGEENNVWLINVEQPLVDFYLLLEAFEESGMIVLEPRID